MISNSKEEDKKQGIKRSKAIKVSKSCADDVCAHDHSPSDCNSLTLAHTHTRSMSTHDHWPNPNDRTTLIPAPQPPTFHHPSIIMRPQHHHELNQLHHFHEVPQWNKQKQVAYEIQYNSKLKTKWNRIGLDWIESNGIEMCWGWYESINDESDKMQSVVIHKMQSVVIHHKCISVKLSEHRRVW